MKSTESLVQLAQAGKLEPFGELVERYEHAAIAVALPIVGDFHHAQDVAQECFVSAFKSLGSLREPQAFGPWLLTSVRRRAQRFASGKQREDALHLRRFDYEGRVGIRAPAKPSAEKRMLKSLLIENSVVDSRRSKSILS